MKEKNHTLAASFRCAWQGITACVRRERNMKIHLCAALAVTAAGVALCISPVEWTVCLILFALVIGGELINTAIEATVDLICPEPDPKAKLAKDAAAGAVLVFAVFAAIIGCILFLPKVMALFS